MQFVGTVTDAAGNTATATVTVVVTGGAVPKPRTLGMRSRNGKPSPPGAPVAVHVAISAIAPTHNTLNMTPLRNAIAAAKATGAAGCNLSLDGGVGESDDAKGFFGSVSLIDPQGLRPDHVTVLFSTPAYQQRAEEITAAVAAVVEPDPFVREMMMWHNGAEFSPEWPIREAGSPSNRATWLTTPGYDVDQDAANIVAMPEMYSRYFHQTRVSTWMPMGFQRITGTPSSSKVTQDYTVNRAFLDNMVRWQPSLFAWALGVDNADLNSYGPNRPTIYALALEYADRLLRTDQTVTTVKMGADGPAAVAQFFSTPNLAKMVADKVYCIEFPAASGMTAAQFQAAHDYIVTNAGSQA